MQYVVPVVGGIAGGMVGGPTGAAVGYSIGSAFVAEGETINTNKLGEISVSTSAYGVPIPKVYGTDIITGNTTWASDTKVKTENLGSTGGKGGGITTLQDYYTIDRKITICQGPIVGIRRVWLNNKLIVEPGGNLPGTLHLGTNTQSPDSYLMQVLGSDVPAWHGEAYMVLQDEYLGQTTVLPNYVFEVVYGDPT